MTDKKVIDFELLGSFSHSGGVSVKAGKKALSFLQYLVVHHTRSISFEELIERFWPEDICDAPGIALRRMMYTIRRILETMFPETDSLLITLPNCYVWNPDICLRLDTELFEAAYMEARKVPENLGGVNREAKKNAACFYRRLPCIRGISWREMTAAGCRNSGSTI